MPNQTRINASVTQCGEPWLPERNLYFGTQGDDCIRSLAFKTEFYDSLGDGDNPQFGTDRCVAVHNVDGSVSGVTGRFGAAGTGHGYIAVYKRKRKSHICNV